MDEKKEKCTKEKKELEFSQVFRKDGVEFQTIIERILLNKIINN